MKTRYLIIIPVVILGSVGLFYLFMVQNGYSGYYEGIGLELFSDHQLNEFLKHPENKEIPITKITDENLKDSPELKKLIEKALAKEYPLNQGGHVPITFKELDNFQTQYSKILAEKYYRNSTTFFKIDDKNMPEKYLERSPEVYLRTFEGRYFEYNGNQYGIQPDTFYIPFMEQDEFLQLEVYKTNGSLREGDHVWADLSEKSIDIKPKIVEAINDIGRHQENIRVQTTGLSPETITKYKNWQKNNLEGFMFEYDERIFSMGFWIA